MGDEDEADGPLDELPDVTETRRVPAQVFRVTGQRQDGGGPDHGGAAVFVMDVPVTLYLEQTVSQVQIRNFAGATLHTSAEIDAVVGGLVLSSEERVPVGLSRMCRRLRRQGRVTLESWGEMQPGFWWYAMVPVWRDDPDVSVDLGGGERGLELWAGATVEQAGAVAVRWGRALPVPRDAAGTAPAISRRSWYLVGVTDVPPPATAR